MSYPEAYANGWNAAVEAVRKEMGNVALHEMAARPHCPVSERNHYERIPPTHVVALDDVWLVLDVVGRWGGADAKSRNLGDES